MTALNDDSDAFDINVLRETFKSEAYDLIGELESALLELEEAPGNTDAVSRVFRALHTIKGSGSACGFDDVARFAHDVETLYDAVRSGAASITREIIDLTLEARDQIAALFDSFYHHQPADPSITAALTVRVRGLLPEGYQTRTRTSAVQSPPHPVPAQRTAETYRIRFRPEPALFQHGTNPLLLLEELRTLGFCRVIAQLNDIPELESLDPEQCLVYWDIILTTDSGVDAIKDVFIFVQDSSEVRIERIDADLVAGDAEYKRLGEILVERGDISPGDLAAVATEQKRFGEMLVEKGLVANDRVESALTEQLHVREVRKERQKAEEMSSVRVHSHKLDTLVNLVGELVTVQARLSQIASTGGGAVLLSIAEEVERLTTELRDNSMSIRMLPIGTIFGKFKRVVRDLSQNLGKQVELVMEGTETELDKTVIEKLHDPLVHLIRNCIDHGIETPEVRASMGKPRQGTIRLTAGHSGARVHITIEDDGAGIDTDAIRRKGIEKGMIAESSGMTENDLYALILAPGFSTARQVTDVSGRGVGMDVVKQAIDALRGTIGITSRRGSGTTITLSLPLTLAIIDGFLTKIGADHFVFPLSLVEECVELSASSIRSGGRDLLNVRGQIVPYIALRERFGTPGERPAIEQVVIVRAENVRVGFVVDDIVGGHQTVIKNLGRMYRGVDGISGATILGDGSVALILDVPKLIHGVEREQGT